MSGSKRQKSHKSSPRSANTNGIEAFISQNAKRPPAVEADAEREQRAQMLADLVAKQSKRTAILHREKLRPKSKAAKHIIRVIIPDSHGSHIDQAAERALVMDIKALQPDEIVGLGDHLDCGGTFSTHQRNYTNELVESYEEDVLCANGTWDRVQGAAPNADIEYLEGNHEQHVERWASRNFTNRRDADMMLARVGPEAVLMLKQRGIRYYRRSEFYDGLSVPGAIKRGKCHFIHGISHSQHAAAKTLGRFGANVVFGHIHRSQSVIERTVSSDGHGAWCPGTLAKLQPLYRHTAPTDWSHGYAVQFVNVSTGRFMHFQVPIHDGVSLLVDTVDAIGSRAKLKRAA